MRTIVKGKNVEVPDRVRSYAERKLHRLERLLDDRTDAIVEFSNEMHRSASDAHIAEVTLVIDGRTLRSHAVGISYQAALDDVVDKVERQAVDYKEKPRLRARPEQEKRILRDLADGTSEPGHERRDGGARPQVLRLRERRNGARGHPLRAERRRPRLDRADRRGRVHDGARQEQRPATLTAGCCLTVDGWVPVDARTLETP